MPKEVTRLYRNVSSDEKMRLYAQKTIRGYISRKLHDNSNIDHQTIHHGLVTELLPPTFKCTRLQSRNWE